MASIRKRGETFTITAYMGYDEQGRQIKKTTTYRPPDGVTAGKAEKLAKAFAAQWEDKVRGYVALDENRTFAELAKWYYTVIAPSTLKPKTMIDYRDEIERHVMPRLGREKLKNITPPMLDTLFADLRENGSINLSYRIKDADLLNRFKREEMVEKSGVSRGTIIDIAHGKTTRRATAEKIAAALGLSLDKAFDDVTEKHGMTGATVNKIKLNLSAIFTAAVRKEIMRRNPCKLVTPPKVDTKPAVFMDEDQCRRFLQALSEQPNYELETACNVMLATGIRGGELLALHWEDLDLATGVLSIQYTLVRYDGQYVRQTPKTASSTRHIILPPYITSMLAKYRRWQAEKRLGMGQGWIHPEIVFPNETGDYMIVGNLNDRFKRVVKAAGLPSELHLHSLRHTHASLLINSDITAKVIADRLGHSTTKTTLDTYAHVFAASEVKAMQAVEMALFKQDAK